MNTQAIPAPASILASYFSPFDNSPLQQTQPSIPADPSPLQYKVNKSPAGAAGWQEETDEHAPISAEERAYANFQSLIFRAQDVNLDADTADAIRELLAKAFDSWLQCRLEQPTSTVDGLPANLSESAMLAIRQLFLAMETFMQSRKTAAESAKTNAESNKAKAEDMIEKLEKWIEALEEALRKMDDGLTNGWDVGKIVLMGLAVVASVALAMICPNPLTIGMAVLAITAFTFEMTQQGGKTEGGLGWCLQQALQKIFPSMSEDQAKLIVGIVVTYLAPYLILSDTCIVSDAAGAAAEMNGASAKEKQDAEFAATVITVAVSLAAGAYVGGGVSQMGTAAESFLRLAGQLTQVATAVYGADRAKKTHDSQDANADLQEADADADKAASEKALLDQFVNMINQWFKRVSAKLQEILDLVIEELKAPHQTIHSILSGSAA